MKPNLTRIHKLAKKQIKQRSIALLLIWIMIMSTVVIYSAFPAGKAFENITFQTDAFEEFIGFINRFGPGTTIYYLKKGDTLYRLSKLYFVSIAEILAINNIKEPNQLAANTKIYIPPVDYGVYNIQEYYLKPHETLNNLLGLFNIALWQFKRLNPTVTNLQMKPGKIIFLPRRPLDVRYRMNVLDYHRMSLRMIRPVSGMLTSRYGSRWGRMHYGIDLAAPAGVPVKAALTGNVIFTGWRGAYGLLVIINHGLFKTYYGHLAAILVKKGQLVNQGSFIGLVGATGRAYGSHLHFEVERDGRKINPLPYLVN